jgi:superfamily I DNA/RNA helicase/inhibitor of KinA sporulation pathway (predicted exonuclease)
MTVAGVLPAGETRVPSPSQRKAIEAAPEALLVLAGPGAGKTFCLIERIRYLIEEHDFDPSRICAFTFTNKAAGEIRQRIELRLGGAAAAQIHGGTIHAFCADLLRKHGSAVGLDPGFGIADEEYQLSVLRRIEGPRRWHRRTLNSFSTFRFRGDSLRHNDFSLFDRYELYLAQRNVLDFDTLVLKAAELLTTSNEAESIRGRWDVVLVDEFQDLNPVQYRVVRALATDHRHVFAVGDDEQSIYSWAGADKSVFTDLCDDFGITAPIHLEENRRCPQDVFALARRLVTINTPLFETRVAPQATRTPVHPVRLLSFGNDDEEAAWLVSDVRRDLEQHGHDWGDVALLYRTHEIGDRLEAAFINAGIRCLLPRGHALSDDPAIAYVIAAARVIAAPHDEQYHEEFFRTVLPAPLFDEQSARSQRKSCALHEQLVHSGSSLPKADENGRQIRRALADWRNLAALARQSDSLAALVQELLSRRVGRVRSVLDDHHDEISDPATLPEAVKLAELLRDVRRRNVQMWIPPLGGRDIPVKGILRAIGVRTARGSDRRDDDAVPLPAEFITSVELPLILFKACQLVEMEAHASRRDNFTAIDLETTEQNTGIAEVVELAAVRVRHGIVVDQFTSLVRPSVPISAGSAAIHGLADADVAGAPIFAEVWPRFREFCGDDVIVAHNGYAFDFKVLERLALATGAAFDLCTLDTLPLARDLLATSRKLGDLARLFGIPAGRSHRALDDTLTLAQVCLELETMKLIRARKTALVGLLDHLGVALALSEVASLSREALLLRKLSRPFALGRYTNCLDFYEGEQGADGLIPSVDEVIELLGGAKLMARIRSDKTAEQRYPAAMLRLRRLITEIPGSSLAAQLGVFLERIVLSRWDGHEPERGRLNLLTLHSTKGLEFSRVYIVGVEDSQMPGGSASKEPTADEIEEARRLLYVGMTRTMERLVLTRADMRGDKVAGGSRFLNEMGLTAEQCGNAID